MLEATVVTTKEELEQIHRLNQLNLKQNLSLYQQQQEGFVSWLYSKELLEKMHRLAPSVIVKHGNTVAGYALTTPKETASFHPALQHFFDNLKQVQYKGHSLFFYRFYCMGQICVAKEFRGKGLVDMLYRKHREAYSNNYDFILTEVSTQNVRSIRVHEKIGFTCIYNYSDETDNWDVVVWDWK